MKTLTKLSFLLFTAILISCSGSSDEETNDIINNDNDNNSNNGEGSSLSGITYSEDIAPIMAANCISCHGNPTNNGAPNSMTTANQVKNAIETRGLISEIESGTMPQNAANLTNDEVEAFKVWQEEGFKD
jgi:mono/diheme cytochrome c family protein